MTTLRIVVVTAGLSDPSSTALLAERIAEASRSALEANSVSAELSYISLRDHAHGIADYLTTGMPTQELATALDQVRAADAVIAVSPTFKAGYSGLFKSFWDLTEDGNLVGVPVLVAATGGVSRHALMLDQVMRPLFSYLRADLVPTAIFATPEDFGTDDTLQTRIERAAGELALRLLWRAGIVSGHLPARADEPAEPVDAAGTDEAVENAAEETARRSNEHRAASEPSGPGV